MNESQINFNLFNSTDAFVMNGTDHSNMTSESTGSASQSLIYVIPGPIICAFGIICNSLNLIVLSHKKLHESPYTYLKALSVSDLTLLLISFFILTAGNLTGTYFKTFFDKVMFFFFANACFNFSVWIIVSMTIERACFVHRPFSASMSRWKTRMRIFVICIVCLVINIPKLFCFEIITGTGNKFYLNGTDFRRSNMFYKISWVNSVINNFIPMIILTVTNATMIFALRKAQKARLSMTGYHSRTQDHDQHRLTRTLVAIVIVFFICVIPSAFVDYPIAYALFGAGMEWDEYLKSPANLILIYICNLLLFLNSSLNFILYCVFNRKFRSAMTDIFQKVHLVRQKKKSCNLHTGTTSSTQV